MWKIKFVHLLQLLAIISFIQLADSELAGGQSTANPAQTQEIIAQPFGKVGNKFHSPERDIQKLQNRRSIVGRGRSKSEGSDSRRSTIALTDQQANNMFQIVNEPSPFVPSSTGIIRRRSFKNGERPAINVRQQKQSKKDQVHLLPKTIQQYASGIIIGFPGPLYQPGTRPRRRITIRKQKLIEKGKNLNTPTIKTISNLKKAQDVSQQPPPSSEKPQDTVPNNRDTVPKGDNVSKGDTAPEEDTVLKGDTVPKEVVSAQTEKKIKGPTISKQALLKGFNDKAALLKKSVGGSARFRQLKQQAQKQYINFEDPERLGWENPIQIYKEVAVDRFEKGFKKLTKIIGLAELDGFTYSLQVEHLKYHLTGTVDPFHTRNHKSQKYMEIQRLLHQLRLQIGGNIANKLVALNALKNDNLLITKTIDQIIKIMRDAVITLRQLVRKFTGGEIQCNVMTHFFDKVYTAGRQTSRQIGVLTQWRLNERDQSPQSQTNIELMRIITICLDAEGLIYKAAMSKLVGKKLFTNKDRVYLQNSKDRINEYLEYSHQGNQYFKHIKSQARFHHFVETLKKAQLATLRLMNYGIKAMSKCGLNNRVTK